MDCIYVGAGLFRYGWVTYAAVCSDYGLEKVAEADHDVMWRHVDVCDTRVINRELKG